MTAPLYPTAAPTTQKPRPSSRVEFSLITSPGALSAVLAANIQLQVSANDALPPAPFEDMTVFHALEPPAISVSDYVTRVAKYAFCSDACLVASFHYITNAIAKEPKLALTSLSVHRLFITALVLASKYFDDVSYNLLYYSKVGGLPYKELANLEVELLRILDFSLGISDVKFMAIENEMVARLSNPAFNPADNLLLPLLTKAKYELSRIVPVELPSPADDVDFTMLVANKERIRRQVARKPHTNVAASVATPEASRLSRISSMVSVSSQAEITHSPDAFNAQQNNPALSNGDKQISHSPTTPPYQNANVATGIAW